MSLTEAFYRRLYTFYKPSESEEFYDKNQIRDKAGKWTRGGDRPSKGLARPTSNKIWSGVSAHPDRRKAPKSDLKFPIERDTYENQKEANFRFARSVYDTDLGGGYRSKTTAVEVFDGKEMSVRGVITHKGKEVGTFDRAFSIEKRGKVVVDHTELMIGSIHRSKGLADRFNSHAVARYQELGVDRVTLHAGDSVGGFAWARQGFRFATPEIAKSVGNRALDNIENSAKYLPALRNDKAALMKEVKAVRKALNAGEDVQPIHIASIGERVKWETVGINGDNVRFMTWPGKRAMLMSSWEGVYYFDANNAVTAAASSIEHANLRPQFRESKPRKVLSNHELVELAFDRNQARNKDGEWSTGGGGPVSISHIRGDIKRERNVILKELDDRGIDEMSPIRHIFQSPMGDKVLVVRNDRGEVVGGMQYLVSKATKEITVTDMRMMVQREGHGTKAWENIAQVARDQGHSLGLHGAIGSAKPFYSKLGAVFLNGYSSGRFTTEARDALAAGTPIKGADLPYAEWVKIDFTA